MILGSQMIRDINRPASRVISWVSLRCVGFLAVFVSIMLRVPSLGASREHTVFDGAPP